MIRTPARLVAIVVGVAIVACGCHLWPGDSEEPVLLEEAAETYVRAALQLAQHDPQLVQDWRGPQEWRPGPRVPVAEIAPIVDRLERQLAAWESMDAGPARYLLWQTRALKLAARRLLGDSTTFADELRALFGDIPVPADAPVATDALAALDRLLPGDAPLAQRLTAHRRRFAIPDERRLEVFTSALAACRAATRAATRLLPDEESVEVAFVSGLGWDGFARYLGHRRTRIEINIDTPLDVPRALHLACHEGYPGHHAQHLLREADAAGGAALDLEPAFGPHLVIAEGAAEAATELVMTAADRERIYRTTLLPAAGLPPEDAPRLVAIEDLAARAARATTPIIRDYLDGRLGAAAAAERLAHDALIPVPETFLAFVDRVRARAVVYTEGRRVLVGYLQQRGLQDGMWRLFVSHPFALQ